MLLEGCINSEAHTRELMLDMLKYWILSSLLRYPEYLILKNICLNSFFHMHYQIDSQELKLDQGYLQSFSTPVKSEEG